MARTRSSVWLIEFRRYPKDATDWEPDGTTFYRTEDEAGKQLAKVSTIGSGRWQFRVRRYGAIADLRPERKGA